MTSQQIQWQTSTMKYYISNKIEMTLFVYQYLHQTLFIYLAEAIFGRIQYYSFWTVLSHRETKESYEN